MVANNNKPRRYSFRNPSLSLHDLLLYGKTLENAENQAEKEEQELNLSQEEVTYNKRSQSSGNKFDKKHHQGVSSQTFSY